VTHERSGTEEESTNISQQPDAEKKKENPELSEEELKKVSGGRKAGGTPPEFLTLPQR
jgi:bacteriocin-like protein